MNPLTVQLRPCRREPDAPVPAYFLPGADTGAWVDALVASGGAADSRLFPVPSALGSSQPVGLLVVGPDCIRGGIPLTQIAGHDFFFPLGAQLDPPLEPGDLDRLLPRDGIHFFHPSAGLLEFDPGGARTLAGLLELPIDEDASAGWGHARTADPFNTKLRAIHVHADAPDAEQQLREAGEEIGDRAIEGVPNPTGRKEFRSGVTLVAARMAKFLTGLAPTDPNKTKRTVVDHLDRWASDVIDRQSRRNRELNRLLDLLRDDPDEGLRYALPVRGGERNWGKAPPGDTLGKRDLDFSLGKLGGGRPGDHWDVPREIERRLIARYRAAAQRELDRGNHRRAAYIFAHLLEDLPAAAAALRSGRHYREAAILYRDQIHDARSAAGCFRDGGLFEEAVALYRDLGEHLVLGDLLTELGRTTEAAQSYQDAIDAHLAKDEPFEAARIAGSKLSGNSAERSLLHDAWPGSKQATRCLQRETELLASESPERARRRFIELRSVPAPTTKLAELAGLLSDIGTGEGDPALRDFAADESRRVAGLALASGGTTARDTFIGAVVRGNRNDRLLGRDGNLYQQSQGRERPPATPIRGTIESLRIEIGQANRFAGMKRILQAEPHPQGVYLFCSTADPDTMRLIDLRHDEPRLEHEIPIDSLAAPLRLTMIPSKIDRGCGAVLASGLTFQRPDRLGIDVIAGVIGLCYDENGCAHSLRHHQGELLVNAHDAGERTFATTILDYVPKEFGVMFEDGLRRLVPMVAQRGQVVLALGDLLVRVWRDQIEIKALPARIISLIASPPLAAFRLVAVLENDEAVLVRGDSDWADDPVTLPTAGGTPRPCFERSGNLILAGERYLVIFDPRQGRIAQQSSGLIPERPIALAAARCAGGFFAVTAAAVYPCRIR